MGEDAMALLGLVNTWIGLIREQGRETQEGQLDQVLEDLGPMPSPLQRPGALSMWVGALINPLPSLGVAYEVRTVTLSLTLTLPSLRSARARVGGQHPSPLPSPVRSRSP